MSTNRSKYYEYIHERLSTLSVAIESDGKLNVLNLHNHSEFFYLEFFKKLFGWNLKNANTETKQNIEGIDLISEGAEKIIIQVSATCTKEKIEASLEKNIIKNNNDYYFKFISISKDASDLRKKDYKNPHNINFDPKSDIYDISFILSNIISLDIDKQKDLYLFIKKELGFSGEDLEKLESNLSTIISILSKENLDESEQVVAPDNFEIERKISFNNLNTARYIIDEYNIYHYKLDSIYSEFDIQGVNKSNSVLKSIRMEYIKNLKKQTDDELFFTIINNLSKKVRESSNFTPIPTEELELCINILVVDAFIRCKIFKNPNNYKYVIA